MGDACARLVEYVHGASGSGEEQVRESFARGMPCHLIVSTGADAVDAPGTRTLAAGMRHR
ncbi:MULTISPECIES: hypothetical protein [Streptomyces]|uniref:Uncharacterized protein n=1 Tax=Streptomyces canarius TaxID=285453 RepID=A0ABQ3CYQ6_9ACTN|nr:hypothetical protein [Streptomyces canarius]GHA49150.1 hypothetical protein GCM10010345_62100 [Streptomyces canarius]